MNSKCAYSNCSEPYVRSVSESLPTEIFDAISCLPKRQTQAEINRDLWWLLTAKGWSYASKPGGLQRNPPEDIARRLPRGMLTAKKDADLTRSSATLKTSWRVDFAKTYSGKLVHLEVQFGKVEYMFKDFCGFQIAWHERRIVLEIEVVMCEPNKYFADRVRTVSGMAYFNVAEKTLPMIGLNCPVWLLGIEHDLK